MRYTAITFSPVQGFIEKSRKLRDLFGASLILSFLSQKIVESANSGDFGQLEVISPGLPNIAQGMPNRILIKGLFPETEVEQVFLSHWKSILKECQQWIEQAVPETTPDTYYHWQRDWEMWGSHTWEFFWGCGESITEAMDNLEESKLMRDWTGINWIGESSSLTGTDAIAWNGLGAGSRNPKTLSYKAEKQAIDNFYQKLAAVVETPSASTPPGSLPEGKVLDLSERLSIPELVKRLVTLPHTRISQNLGMPTLRSFSDLQRKPDPQQKFEGQWTGWFMGDGDRVGKLLTRLSLHPDGDGQIKAFSEAMRTWGEDLRESFPSSLGRVVYAGGDDFLGLIYNTSGRTPSSDTLKSDAIAWLQTLRPQWQDHKQPITLSVGFVWAGHSVPQRDILQHCREAEQRAKQYGRDRVTLRVVFNSGQYVQWTCRWQQLELFSKYRDREGGTNWSHIYSDFQQLLARHAISPDDPRLALSLLNIYFDNYGQYLLENLKDLIGEASELAMFNWICDFIEVSWQLCR